jgi:hypothetical protein
MAVGLALTSALCGTGAAWAQQSSVDSASPSPNVTVQQRERPDYDPLGIRARSFLIFPRLSVDAEFNDNVFATDDDSDSDVGAILSPNIEAQSDWSRHALNFSAGATSGTFYEYQKNNYLDFFGQATGRLDVTRDNVLSGLLRAERLHQGREDPDQDNDLDDADQGSSGRGDLSEYYRMLADTSYRHNFNRLFTVLGAGAQRLTYDDSGNVQGSRRDRNEYTGRLRLGYELSPRIDLFGEGRYSYRDYDKEQIFQGEEVDKNSHGYQARLGTDIDLTGILFGELALTYSERRFVGNEYKDTSGFGGNGSLIWNVTPLTSIILDLSSEIKETTVQFEGDVADSDFENAVGLDVTHELLRNLLLNANTRFERDDFEGTGRTDHTWSAGAGATYLVNRNLSLDADYRYTNRSSDSPNARYDRNLVLVGFTLRL